MASTRPPAGRRAGREFPIAQSRRSTIRVQAGLDQSPVWLSGQPERWVIAVRAQPGARRVEVVGEHGGCLKVRVDAPAIEGRANAALLRFIAERLGLRVAQVTLIAGASSRDKRVLALSPLERAQIVRRLLGAQTS